AVVREHVGDAGLERAGGDGGGEGVHDAYRSAQREGAGADFGQAEERRVGDKIRAEDTGEGRVGVEVADGENLVAGAAAVRAANNEAAALKRAYADSAGTGLEIEIATSIDN